MSNDFHSCSDAKIAARFTPDVRAMIRSSFDCRQKPRAAPYEYVMVRFNGEPATLVVAGSQDEGWIDCYVPDPSRPGRKSDEPGYPDINGCMMVGPDGKLITVRRYGKVEIIFPETVPN